MQESATERFEDLKLISTRKDNSSQNFKEAVLKDLWICQVSREASLLCRKEVLTGKAKFGIMGDGKELPQVVLSRFFNKGDFRSGYYRDQTMVMALGLAKVEDLFAQLYADTANDPFSSGRQMNSHFATKFVDNHDQFINLKEQYNISSDISSTGGQMARALGLALTSKKIKESKELGENYSHLGNGDEVVYCTIGDASTSEGIFWETLNAATVMEVPLVVSVWDDGYGISVPKKYQTSKGSISAITAGFEIDESGQGLYIITVNGWDYVSLHNAYEKASQIARVERKPVLVHVEELTQPQGHSTSGSHERYKSEDRLNWEREHDCLNKFKDWITLANIASQEEIDKLCKNAKKFVKEKKDLAWSNFYNPVLKLKNEVLNGLEQNERYAPIISEIKNLYQPSRHDLVKVLRKLLNSTRYSATLMPDELRELLERELKLGDENYHTHLYSHADSNALEVPVVSPLYIETSKVVSGYQVINAYFDYLFDHNPLAYAFGEDVGNIGDVNQGFAGLQEKYGESRVFDTGIREWTIIGQAIGMSMRGLRPIAEIQYLDYLIYGLAPLTDDLSTLRYRSAGLQIAPAIIRTRGHRLEGIWHSGSQMGMMLSTLRGMYICVPRNFVQAAGMYNTLIRSTDPAVVVEPLNAYRRKEKLPENIGEYTVPLGSPDILEEGQDVTIVTYGSCVPVVMDSLTYLKDAGISAEVIDVQTLLPFDLEHRIGASLAKTNRLLIVDEDLPGSCSAYILQNILETQNGYFSLDSQPRTLSAKEHRPPYGDEGDYYTKPQTEDVVEYVIDIMQEAKPYQFN